MAPFEYLDDQLVCDSVPLARLAREFGTPLYVYSATAIRDNYRRLAAAFAPLRPLVCYAVKANFNLSLLALMDAGAYGFSMASQYNARPRPAEVLVEGEQVRLVRRRETYEDMTALEV